MSGSAAVGGRLMLWDLLVSIPDRRGAKGRQYPLADVAAAERILGAWARGGGPLGHVAIDGKRLRGSAPAGHDGSEGVHLVAAFASRLGGVIGQLRVAPDSNEITAALALLGDCRSTAPSSPAMPSSASAPFASASGTATATICSRSRPTNQP
jgi:hypothetical protein